MFAGASYDDAPFADVLRAQLLMRVHATQTHKHTRQQLVYNCIQLREYRGRDADANDDDDEAVVANMRRVLLVYLRDRVCLFVYRVLWPKINND